MLPLQEPVRALHPTTHEEIEIVGIAEQDGKPRLVALHRKGAIRAEYIESARHRIPSRWEK